MNAPKGINFPLPMFMLLFKSLITAGSTMFRLFQLSKNKRMRAFFEVWLCHIFLLCDTSAFLLLARMLFISLRSSPIFLLRTRLVPPKYTESQYLNFIR